VEEPDLREYYICFLRDVMKTSRSYQSRLNEGMKVIYAGVEGAFGYIASKRAFPEAKLTAASDFTEAYRAVEAGEYDCAVLPIENSYAGDVGAVMDLMFSGSLYVNRMIELEVEHNLLGCHGAKLNEIRTVVSHPQALEQCAEFIRSHGWQTLSYSNTALAAQYVAGQNDPTVAAIACNGALGVIAAVLLAGIRIICLCGVGGVHSAAAHIGVTGLLCLGLFRLSARWLPVIILRAAIIIKTRIIIFTHEKSLLCSAARRLGAAGR